MLKDKEKDKNGSRRGRRGEKGKETGYIYMSDKSYQKTRGKKRQR